MNQGFLNKLKNYLDVRLKDEVTIGSFEPFEIDIPEVSRRWRWGVRTPSFAMVRFVTEYEYGTVTVQSKSLDRAKDYIGECLIKSYRFRFAKAKSDREEKEKIWEIIEKREKEALEDYFNRRNLEKHLREPYWHAFLRLLLV
ncbi:MAG: hypothetical protein N3F08_00115 [Crenarchaeota archaeon]|nr:hypothetical protein [Thermoproteota archaeon]